MLIAGSKELEQANPAIPTPAPPPPTRLYQLHAACHQASVSSEKINFYCVEGSVTLGFSVPCKYS